METPIYIEYVKPSLSKYVFKMIQKDLHIATIRWFEYGLVSRIKNHWNAIETLGCADTKLFGSQTTLFVTIVGVE